MTERELWMKKVVWAMDKASLKTIKTVYKFLIWLIGEEGE